ncbi:hydroxyacylglutathione hydrolase [Nematocida displodere]|uniref:Hydroxyacylglutathione hydrolase n=1 Tax=Nematocida displodere TaxID=1805483 RepID=A0A177EJ37_9MICR|nr:hydroxyacylglutathione hydrolase [Nematocida displodere]
MKVFPVRTRETNLMYIVVGREKNLILVDAIDIPAIKECLSSNKIEYSSTIALTTHSHPDHNSGNPKLEEHFPGITIYAGSSRSYAHHLSKDREAFVFGDFSVTPIHTPCHTLDSLSYLVRGSSGEESAIFVGDTLFYLGCGKFFEGPAEMMAKSLQAITSVPEQTTVYYGHNYNLANLQFRLEFAPSPNLPEKEFLTVGEEKKWNLFINTDLLATRPEFSALSPVARLKKLRELKDAWNPGSSAASPAPRHPQGL